MKYTSSEAAKLLRRLAEQRELLLAQERDSREFVAAIQEDLESARPAYDFAATQAELEDIDARIRRVKHAVNVFNATHQVPGFDMTIDEVLVYLPQLTKRKEKLAAMARRLPKQREDAGYSNTKIEYNYANYDVAEARRALDETADRLSRLQVALDTANTQLTMEIDI